MVSNISKQELNRGFTLIELLVTILISSVVLSSIGLLLGTGLRGTRTASEIATVSQNTEVASALLQTELRQAGYLGQPGDSVNDAAYLALLAAAAAAPNGWPFTNGAGAPFAPIRQLAPGAGALTAIGCNAGALPLGCIEVVSVRSRPSSPGATEPYYLLYVRYEVRVVDGIPALRRASTGVDRVPCNASFVCTFPTSTTEALSLEAVQGVEEFRLFETTDGINWTALTGDLAPGARLGIYFRARSLQPELTGDGTFTPPGIDLPAGVAIPAVAVTDSFRRTERWLDLEIPNN